MRGPPTTVRVKPVEAHVATWVATLMTDVVAVTDTTSVWVVDMVRTVSDVDVLVMDVVAVTDSTRVSVVLRVFTRDAVEVLATVTVMVVDGAGAVTVVPCTPRQLAQAEEYAAKDEHAEA